MNYHNINEFNFELINEEYVKMYFNEIQFKKMSLL